MEQRWNARQYPCYAYPNEPAPPHHATILARFRELDDLREEEEEEERRRRVAIWRDTAPDDMREERQQLDNMFGTDGTTL